MYDDLIMCAGCDGGDVEQPTLKLFVFTWLIEFKRYVKLSRVI